MPAAQYELGEISPTLLQYFSTAPSLRFDTSVVPTYFNAISKDFSSNMPFAGISNLFWEYKINGNRNINVIFFIILLIKCEINAKNSESNQ